MPASSIAEWRVGQLGYVATDDGAAAVVPLAVDKEQSLVFYDTPEPLSAAPVLPPSPFDSPVTKTRPKDAGTPSVAPQTLQDTPAPGIKPAQATQSAGRDGIPFSSSAVRSEEICPQSTANQSSVPIRQGQVIALEQNPSPAATGAGSGEHAPGQSSELAALRKELDMVRAEKEAAEKRSDVLRAQNEAYAAEMAQQGSMGVANDALQSELATAQVTVMNLQAALKTADASSRQTIRAHKELTTRYKILDKAAKSERAEWQQMSEANAELELTVNELKSRLRKNAAGECGVC